MSYAGSGQDEMKGEGKNSVAQLVVGGMTVALLSRTAKKLVLMITRVGLGADSCSYSLP
jgi:hypothetical protein